MPLPSVCPQRILAEAKRIIETYAPLDDERVNNNLDELDDLIRWLPTKVEAQDRR